MTWKHALWATGAWTLFGVALSAFLIWYIMTHPVAGATKEARAQRAGQGTAVFMSIGYAGIWLPYAYLVGKRRREAEAQRPKKKKKQREEE